MEATERQSGAGCVLQMKLQRTRSRVWEFRPFSSGFGEMCMQQGEHIRAPGLTQQKTRECQGDLQSLSRLRDHTPMNPVERTTPFKAMTSSRIRCARVEIPTSAALAMLSFSITGSRLWITSATTSNTGHCGPPPIKASIRIKGPGRPAARKTGYSSRPNCNRAPVAVSVCFIHVRERSKSGATGQERAFAMSSS